MLTTTTCPEYHRTPATLECLDHLDPDASQTHEHLVTDLRIKQALETLESIEKTITQIEAAYAS